MTTIAGAANGNARMMTPAKMASVTVTLPWIKGSGVGAVPTPHQTAMSNPEANKKDGTSEGTNK